MGDGITIFPLAVFSTQPGTKHHASQHPESGKYLSAPFLKVPDYHGLNLVKNPQWLLSLISLPCKPGLSTKVDPVFLLDTLLDDSHLYTFTPNIHPSNLLQFQHFS